MNHRRAQIEEIEDDQTVGNRFTEVNDDFDDDTDLPLPEFKSPSLARQQQAVDDDSEPQFQSSEDGKFKGWTMIYPLYLDASKTLHQGRRVSAKEAIKNPLAQGIAHACSVMQFQAVFEPMKCHPADWSNPGRVRLEFKNNGVPVHKLIKTKKQLLKAISIFLQAHPTQPDDPFKVKIAGLSIPDKLPAKAAIPKGMKINEVLPLHSRMTSGGGASSNMLGSMASMMGINIDEEEEEAKPTKPVSKKTQKVKRQIIRG